MRPLLINMDSVIRHMRDTAVTVTLKELEKVYGKPKEDPMAEKQQFELRTEEELYERSVGEWDVFVTEEGNGHAVFCTEQKGSSTYIATYLLSFSQNRDRAIEFATTVDPDTAEKVQVILAAPIAADEA